MTTNEHSLEGLAQWLRSQALFASAGNAVLRRWADEVEAASLPHGDVEGLMELVDAYAEHSRMQERHNLSAGCGQFEPDVNHARANVVRAIASRLAAPASTPEGYVLVPKEPTREMLLASYHPKVNSAERSEIYSAMIAATPQVPMEGLPVRWVGADGANHEISIDYAAQIAQWMFDTYGDVAQVDAVLATPQPQPAKTPAHSKSAYKRRVAQGDSNVLPPVGVPVVRVLDRADAFCPKCGHNRDTSSVSSIDHGEHQSCQLCGAEWREADGVSVPPLSASDGTKDQP